MAQTSAPPAPQTDSRADSRDGERRYADLLRSVGQFLDAQGALQVEMIERESGLAVSWRKLNGVVENRTFREDAPLEHHAPMIEPAPDAPAPVTRADLLSAL